MMADNYESERFFLYEIRVRQIIFDESADVTIFGSIPDENDYEKSISFDFLCSFGLLTDLLLFADDKSKGDWLITAISEKLSAAFDIPAVIDVENIFGRELIFSSIIFKVYKPKEKDENGKWQYIKDNCYFIEELEEKSMFYARAGTDFLFKEHTQEFEEDLLAEALNNLPEIEAEEKQFSEYLHILDGAYDHYLQLIVKDFSEKKARKRTGLTDELLFRIAVLNNKIIKK